jgi:hypothetical protein
MCLIQDSLIPMARAHLYPKSLSTMAIIKPESEPPEITAVGEETDAASEVDMSLHVDQLEATRYRL